MEELLDLVKSYKSKVAACCEARDFDRGKHWLSKAEQVAQRHENEALTAHVQEARRILARHEANAEASKRANPVSQAAVLEAQRIAGCTFATRDGGRAPNYYLMFKIERTANSGEIKSAFRKLSLLLHPDRAGDDAAVSNAYKAVTAGNDVLNTHLLRAAHDARIDGNYAMAATYEARHKQNDKYEQAENERAEQAQQLARENAARAAAASASFAFGKRPAAADAPAPEPKRPCPQPAAPPSGKAPPPSGKAPPTHGKRKAPTPPPTHGKRKAPAPSPPASKKSKAPSATASRKRPLPKRPLPSRPRPKYNRIDDSSDEASFTSSSDEEEDDHEDDPVVFGADFIATPMFDEEACKGMNAQREMLFATSYFLRSIKRLIDYYELHDRGIYVSTFRFMFETYKTPEAIREHQLPFSVYLKQYRDRKDVSGSIVRHCDMALAVLKRICDAAPPPKPSPRAMTDNTRAPRFTAYRPMQKRQ